MQGNERYRLIVRRGPQPNQVYELGDNVVNLGRDITNHIVINDREVSRHHLRFTRGPEGYTVEDLGSTNGTFVNGKRVTGATLLKNGDLLGLGETVTLGYELVRGEAGASPPAAQPSQQPQQPAPSQQEQSPPQRQDSGYDAPQQQGGYSQQSPYQPQQQDYQQQPAYAEEPPPYEQQGQDAYGGYYPAPQQQGAYAAGTPQGYEYDPYALREEEGSNPMRWVLFGCIGLMLFCCCITLLLIIFIDANNLYCQIPILNDILAAVGLC